MASTPKVSSRKVHTPRTPVAKRYRQAERTVEEELVTDGLHNVVQLELALERITVLEQRVRDQQAAAVKLMGDHHISLQSAAYHQGRADALTETLLPLMSRLEHAHRQHHEHELPSYPPPPPVLTQFVADLPSSPLRDPECSSTP